MKKFMRTVTFLLLVGGWALASASVYVVRTPAKVPTLVLRNQFGYSDWYLDTRNWTINDDRAHPMFVSRVLELGRSDLLAHTLNSNMGPANVQLATIVAAPNSVAANTKNLTDKLVIKTP